MSKSTSNREKLPGYVQLVKLGVPPQRLNEVNLNEAYEFMLTDNMIKLVRDLTIQEDITVKKAFDRVLEPLRILTTEVVAFIKSIENFNPNVQHNFTRYRLLV